MTGYTDRWSIVRVAAEEVDASRSAVDDGRGENFLLPGPPKPSITGTMTVYPDLLLNVMEDCTEEEVAASLSAVYLNRGESYWGGNQEYSSVKDCLKSICRLHRDVQWCARSYDRYVQTMARTDSDIDNGEITIPCDALVLNDSFMRLYKTCSDQRQFIPSLTAGDSDTAEHRIYQAVHTLIKSREIPKIHPNTQDTIECLNKLVKATEDAFDTICSAKQMPDLKTIWNGLRAIAIEAQARITMMLISSHPEAYARENWFQGPLPIIVNKSNGKEASLKDSLDLVRSDPGGKEGTWNCSNSIETGDTIGNHYGDGQVLRGDPDSRTAKHLVTPHNMDTVSA
ncbi:hypothetical protein M231_06096 [Tremella mesenterica]|uniref:Uncharacterized protein n=1 Tax=Tremella mesenterica TaxID=5217 RepID=A0A4Q1BGH7_TREME|nr:uncharacterized protein TREMEDRAFT_65094 [Tremella mesenterica DSM 1558]EIW66701.1 hypothetical protein TREMEDRAFT_65094 [Tremella mesenterica DSM 1558]RXK36633.1 hypothetical protein M231_06096 [Tremella mesenterica]